MQEHAPLLPLSTSQQEALEEAVTTYATSLGEDEAGVAWVTARGLTQETALTFRLGVVAEPFPGHEKYDGWLAIPYLDQHGSPLTVRFRCPLEHDHRAGFHGKYMTLFEDPPRVFNIRAIHEATDTIHVTEGEIDAMILNQLDLPAVAIPGASGFQPHHRRMLAGFSRVWVWGDPDEAGGNFTREITNRLPRSAKGVRLRGGDVNEVYLKHGASGIYALVEEE